VSGPSQELWEELTSFSETYTCYSAAVAAWIALGEDGWRERLNPGLWLTLTDEGGGLFGFGHFPPTLRASLGLVPRGSGDEDDALAAILDELASNGRVILAGDGRRLPWHVAYRRRHVPHWFLVAGDPRQPLVVDPFACVNELGRQEATTRELAVGDLGRIIGALPQEDPVYALRESLALGDDLRPLPPGRFRWFAHETVEETRPPEGRLGPDAICRLAEHFRARGQDASAYRQVDDIWSIARHRAFLARLEEPVAPLAERWGHMAPLLMQATLALAAGRPASASVPDTLEQLAALEELVAGQGIG
jgi:hypothetical protein